MHPTRSSPRLMIKNGQGKHLFIVNRRSYVRPHVSLIVCSSSFPLSIFFICNIPRNVKECYSFCKTTYQVTLITIRTIKHLTWLHPVTSKSAYLLLPKPTTFASGNCVPNSYSLIFVLYQEQLVYTPLISFHVLYPVINFSSYYVI